jgi:hypothetical protein
MKLFNMRLFHSPITSSLISPNVLHSTLLSVALSVCCCERPIFIPALNDVSLQLYDGISHMYFALNFL